MMTKWTKWAAVVATPNAKNDPILQAYVYDFLPFTSGNILKITDKTVKIKLKDVFGNDIEQIYTSTSTIEAEYLALDDNVTIPDVVPGERIEVYQYKKQGKYFWKSLKRDSKLRKTEHYRIHAADKPKKMDELSDDNTYYFEIDTTKDNKFIRLSTSSSDGESFRYVIEIDCINNSVNIADDDFNRIYLHTPTQQIILENKSSSKVELLKKVINISSLDTINIMATENINLKSRNINEISDSLPNPNKRKKRI